jgi:hypothetical protein
MYTDLAINFACIYIVWLGAFSAGFSKPVRPANFQTGASLSGEQSSSETVTLWTHDNVRLHNVGSVAIIVASSEVHICPNVSPPSSSESATAPTTPSEADSGPRT